MPVVKARSMVDDPHSALSIRVRRCTIHVGRWRWHLLEDGYPYEASPESYGTRVDAEAAGQALLEKLTSGLHAGNEPIE
jgi:hypothetical protein